MIKKCLLAVLTAAFLFGNAAIVHAQKIYLFSEGDYFDHRFEDGLDMGIGNAVASGTSKVRQLFRRVPEHRLVIYNESSEWSGPNFKSSFDDSGDVRNAIFRAIRNCPAGPSDTIVFYWNSHGAYDDKGHFLWMPKINGERSAIYRSEIRRALLEKGARLTVLFTESCHVYQNFPCLSPTQEPYFIKPYEVPRIFNALFFNYSGIVDFNTSSPGECSWCQDTLGGFFTHYFCSTIEDNIDKSMSWKSLLDTTQTTLVNCPTYKKKGYYHHYYYWHIPGYPSKPDGKDDYNDDDDDDNYGNASEPIYHPGTGDRIVSVNGTSIQNEAHFRQVIANANTRVILTVVDQKTGNHYKLMTDLSPKGSTTRLGIYVEDDYRGGVAVTGVMQGTPGNRCRLLNGGNGGGGNGGGGGAAIYHPENGDRIIYVNGISIEDEDHFRRVIRDADTHITLTIVDHRTGNTYKMSTDLFPKGSTTRLGIYIEDDYRGGVVVTGVMPGSPGNRCRVLK